MCHRAGYNRIDVTLRRLRVSVHVRMHWPRPALATTALALLGATAATGHQAITAEQLKGALLPVRRPDPGLVLHRQFDHGARLVA
jgi:hypothetical protein